MARVVWTDEALRNLEQIGDYLLDHAPSSVRLTLESLFDAADRLRQFPRMGRLVPGFEQESLRELVHAEYRIVYTVAEETVAILALFHGGMDIDARLRVLLDS